MTLDRSVRREVRNPVLALPAARRLQDLAPRTRAALADVLGEMSVDARRRAEASWRANKAPMAAYWRAVCTYANHIRRVVHCSAKRRRQAMGNFAVETAYHLPIYRHRNVDANSPEEACRLAIDDESWDDEQSDYENAGETYVTGIWADTDRAYSGRAVPVPERFQETVQRKAEIFDALLALLKEPAQPRGLSSREFESWRQRALEVIARAESIGDG